MIPPKGTGVQEGARTASPQPGDGRGGITPPLRNGPTLGQVVAYYKYETTKQINDLFGNDPMPFWQRSFYDRIIRNRRVQDAVGKYIAGNPRNWELDQDHPNNVLSA